jgi:hypothetical protein
MVAFSKIVPALLAASFTAAADHDTYAKLTKPTLNENIDFLKAGLIKNLPETKYTLKKWDAGWIPSKCKDLAKDTKTSPKDFEIYDVTYTDVSRTLFLITRD